MDKKVNNEYWKKRSQILEQATFDNTKDEYKKIAKAFDKSQKEIQAKIDKWLARIAKNNGEITLEEAKTLLDKNELAEFHWIIDEYIKYGKENAIDQRWMKELENASAKHHIDKLTALKLECQAEYDKAFNTENQKVTDAVKEAYTDRYDHVGYEVQKGFNVGFKLNGISEEKLDKVIRKPWAPDGKNFSDRIWTKKEQMVEELYQALVRNTLGGSNLKDVINSMTKYVDKSTKNAKSAAARLVMTESAYFASQGQKDCFNDLGVEKYEIVATLDNKTSDICQGLDGKVFEMKEFEPGTTAPPFHINCRSTTAPYFDDEFSLGERAARGEDGKTYYVPSDMTYKEWKEAQDNLNNDKIKKIQNDIEKKEEPKVIRFNDITDKWTEKTKDGSYAECESVTINGKTYKVGDNGVNLNIDVRAKEIEVAKALSEKYNKEVVLLPEISGKNKYIRIADLMVDGKVVEIKTINSNGKNTIKHAFENAKGQAKDVIINIGNDKLNKDKIIEKVQALIGTEQSRHINTCIIMKNGEVLKVVEQKNIGTAHLQKQVVIPTIDNVTIKTDKSQLQNDEKNGKIKPMYSGAISGALDRNSKEAMRHAERYYESIRNRKDEDYLNIIAKRSKLDVDDIRVIKNYIFIDKHELSDGYRRFDSDYEMAESWQRLSDENMELKPQDIIMLNHELLEKQLVDKGYTQEEAHNEANKKFNYEEFFDK